MPPKIALSFDIHLQAGRKFGNLTKKPYLYNGFDELGLICVPNQGPADKSQHNKLALSEAYEMMKKRVVKEMAAIQMISEQC